MFLKDLPILPAAENAGGQQNNGEGWGSPHYLIKPNPRGENRAVHRQISSSGVRNGVDLPRSLFLFLSGVRTWYVTSNLLMALVSNRLLFGPGL